ncbi:folate-binding protein YgfZ [Bermanella marisrubri]|uniref:Aminomethyl transferase, putative n=1 Tax=Bermanella marisrubri TaxID=207949 RepID=Q1N1G5_9GAMM|nr:folate-binding protein YgfZ [Bermanella marisrubri]EAT12085.1 aminomethyl transferase, putative [Oceanobacter sp. RED65] [Bermanella marisrubri]QIZ83551.1 folate-binding protein YgfZ [Bermanella marisrubri]
MQDLQSYSINDCDYLIIQGPDSAKFMQGQFTCDINQATSHQFLRGACCNAKGRMVASFDLSLIDKDQYLLVMAKGLADILQNHLKKYAVFFKAEIVKKQFNAYHFDTITNSDLTEDFSQSRTGERLIKRQGFNAGFDVIQLSADASGIDATVNVKQPSQDVNLARIQAGLARVTPETSEELIPQMLNLQLTNGVSFKKGCYTGQEIVARMQYLGKLKRHCYRVAFNQAAEVGDSLFAGDKSIGTLVNLAANGDGFEGLAVIEDKHLNAPLTLGSQSTPIEVLCLPYEPQQGDEE